MELDTSVSTGPVGFDFILCDNHITNATGSNLLLTWTRTDYALTTGWEGSVCDKNMCWLPTDFTKNFQLASGETAILKLQYAPNNLPGSALTKLTVAATGGSGWTTEAYYHASTDITGVTRVNAVKDIFIYPTPVRENMYVVFNQNLRPNRVEVFNVLGQKVKSFSVQLDRNATRIELQLNDLHKGTYFVRLYHDNGNSVITRQITKG